MQWSCVSWSWFYVVDYLFICTCWNILAPLESSQPHHGTWYFWYISEFYLPVFYWEIFNLSVPSNLSFFSMLRRDTMSKGTCRRKFIAAYSFKDHESLIMILGYMEVTMFLENWLRAYILSASWTQRKWVFTINGIEFGNLKAQSHNTPPTNPYLIILPEHFH